MQTMATPLQLMPRRADDSSMRQALFSTYSPADDVAVYPYCRALYRACIALCVRYRGSLKGHGANEDRPSSQLYTHAKSSFYVHNECLLNRVSADYHFSYFAYLKKNLRGTLETVPECD